MHYNSAKDDAEVLCQELQKLGVQAKSFEGDLGSYDAVRTLHAKVQEAMGDPDILYNNAGIAPQAGVKDIKDLSIDDFERTWRTNCGAAYLLTQLCVPAMQTKGWGRVIFCSSVAGFTGGVVGPHYA